MLTTAAGIATFLKRGLVLPLLFLGVGVSTTSLGMAQPAGTFTPSGSMTTPRTDHTATLLPTGKVLIAGGQVVTSSGAIEVRSSAELYDPATGAFAATGSMSVARVGHTATLLTNGQVLIAGGFNVQDRALASTELYDPSMGAFTATGSMSVARVGHTATLLTNGQVLIAGGDNGGAPFFASAEIYDPATGAFTVAGDMTMARVAHTATLLSNGKILFDGGYVLSSEIYDPAAGTFSQTGGTTYYSSFASNLAESWGSATLLPDGKVLLTLLCKTWDGDVVSDSAALYDPSTETFLSTGKATAERYSRTATLLPDGTVLIAGLNYGGGAGTAISHADLYDPAAGTFSATGNMTAGRIHHTATLLPDGTVLIAGGAQWGGNGVTNGPWSFVDTAEIYHPVGPPAPAPGR